MIGTIVAFFTLLVYVLVLAALVAFVLGMLRAIYLMLTTPPEGIRVVVVKEAEKPDDTA